VLVCKLRLNELVMVGGREQSPCVPPLEIKLGESISAAGYETSLKSCEPTIVNGAKLDTSHIGEAPIKSLLMVPISAAKREIGMIELGSITEPYDEWEKSNARAVADQVGLTLSVLGEWGACCSELKACIQLPSLIKLPFSADEERFAACGDNLLAMVRSIEESDPGAQIFVAFFSSASETGERWSEESGLAETTVAQVFAPLEEARLIEVTVREEDWKNHPLRSHEAWKLARLPSLVHWSSHQVVQTISYPPLINHAKLSDFVSKVLAGDVWTDVTLVELKEAAAANIGLKAKGGKKAFRKRRMSIELALDWQPDEQGPIGEQRTAITSQLDQHRTRLSAMLQQQQALERKMDLLKTQLGVLETAERLEPVPPSPLSSTASPRGKKQLTLAEVPAFNPLSPKRTLNMRSQQQQPQPQQHRSPSPVRADDVTSLEPRCEMQLEELGSDTGAVGDPGRVRRRRGRSSEEPGRVSSALEQLSQVPAAAPRLVTVGSPRPDSPAPPAATKSPDDVATSPLEAAHHVSTDNTRPLSAKKAIISRMFAGADDGQNGVQLDKLDSDDVERGRRGSVKTSIFNSFSSPARVAPAKGLGELKPPSGGDDGFQAVVPAA
jgi:hypothetical protein